MKMEFMEVKKKTLHIPSCLLWERGRNKRLTQVLSWPSNFRQDFQEQHLHWGPAKQLLQGFTVTLFPRALECFPLPGCPHSSGGQSLCSPRGKLLTSSTEPAPRLQGAGAEKTLDYSLWSRVLFQQLTDSSRRVLQ